MKRYISLISIIACLILLTSCSAPVTEPTQTPTPTAAPTKAPTPEPEPQPKPEQTPDPMQIKFDMAPEIDGLIKEIREKDGEQKVVYLYEEDNPYGGVAGEYVGEFKKEVEITSLDAGEMIEVGGVVLNSDVVLSYINKLDSGDFGITPIGLDISSLTNQEKISIFLDQDFQVDNRVSSLGSIKIEFEGATLPLISVDNNKTTYVLSDHNPGIGFFVENKKAYDYRWGDNDPYFYTSFPDNTYLITPESYLGGMGVYGDFEKDNNGMIILDVDKIYSFGDKILEVNSSVYLGWVHAPSFGFFTGDTSLRFPAHSIDGCLVFVCEKDS